jgi:hypothetical protein
MGDRVKWLTEGTRAAALIAVALWAWPQWAGPEARVMADQPGSRQEDLSRAAERDKQASECRADLEAWDSGERAEMVRKHGGRAATIIAECRSLDGYPAG